MDDGEKQYILCADLGGTQIRVALCSADDGIVRRAVVPTMADEGPRSVISRLATQMRHVIGDTTLAEIAAAGIAAPGPLDPWKGIVREAPNLPGWRNVPLADEIGRMLGMPVFLGNDANLAALGEHAFGAGKGVDDMIYITVSTGIGGGIISGGRLLLGSRGLAAEVGHQTLEAHGVRCKCGNIGCVEAYASGTAIARRASEIVGAGRETSLARLDTITGRDVAEAARNGDAVAMEVMQEAGFYLGVGIVNLLHLFNPSRVILGGSVTKSWDLFADTMWETIRSRAQPPYLEGLEIVRASLGDDAGLMGAMALVLDRKVHGGME